MAEAADKATDARDAGKQKGSVQVNWPRTIGYFSALGLAVAVDVIEWPLALFIGALPFVRLLEAPQAPKGEREAGDVLIGAGQATGSSPEGTITPGPSRPKRSTSR